MINKFKKVSLGLVAMLLPWSAHSLESIIGKVTYLEPTYMPTTIRFTMDSGNTACPAGKAIHWSKENIDNNKVVYSSMMAAMMANKSIRIYINDGDASCKAQFLHLLK